MGRGKRKKPILDQDLAQTFPFLTINIQAFDPEQTPTRTGLTPPANSLPTACPYLNVLFTDRQNPLLTTHHSTYPALRSIVHSFITNNQPPSRPLKPNPILNRLLPLPLPLPLLHLPPPPSSSPSTNLCNTLASSLTLSSSPPPHQTLRHQPPLHPHLLHLIPLYPPPPPPPPPQPILLPLP